MWGVNDFDEAAEMPYVLDLVRLAASALLARQSRRGECRAAAICRALLEGYRQGLAAPQAIVLDRDWAGCARCWPSRTSSARSSGARSRRPSRAAHRALPRALAAAMPEPRLEMRTARRTAGAGSLGRPRWIGVAEWRGAPVVREAKVVLASAWHRGAARSRARRSAAPRSPAVGTAPTTRGIGSRTASLLRRLSPNNRKVEAENESVSLLTPDMLSAMGLELANVHLGTGDRAPPSCAISRPQGRLAARQRQARGRRRGGRVRGVEGAVAAWVSGQLRHNSGETVDMTKSMAPRTTRRHLLAGGAAALLASLGALRHASAQAPAASGLDYAVFTELSPESKLLKGGWNTRVFTNTDSRKGNAIQCDFATGIVTVAPGVYHISGMSIVAYNSGGEPPEMTTIRAPASAGYCRLRTLGSNSVVDPGMRDIANDDPSVVCLGSPAPPTSPRACSKPISKPTGRRGWFSSINREAIPNRSICASSSRIRSGTRWPGSRRVVWVARSA